MNLDFTFILQTIILIVLALIGVLSNRKSLKYKKKLQEIDSIVSLPYMTPVYKLLKISKVIDR